jgi:hypothetical protein
VDPISQEAYSRDPAVQKKNAELGTEFARNTLIIWLASIGGGKYAHSSSLASGRDVTLGAVTVGIAGTLWAYARTLGSREYVTYEQWKERQEENFKQRRAVEKLKRLNLLQTLRAKPAPIYVVVPAGNLTSRYSSAENAKTLKSISQNGLQPPSVIAARGGASLLSQDGKLRTGISLIGVPLRTHSLGTDNLTDLYVSEIVTQTAYGFRQISFERATDITLPLRTFSRSEADFQRLVSERLHNVVLVAIRCNQLPEAKEMDDQLEYITKSAESFGGTSSGYCECFYPDQQSIPSTSFDTLFVPTQLIDLVRQQVPYATIVEVKSTKQDIRISSSPNTYKTVTTEAPDFQETVAAYLKGLDQTSKVFLHLVRLRAPTDEDFQKEPEELEKCPPDERFELDSSAGAGAAGAASPKELEPVETRGLQIFGARAWAQYFGDVGIEPPLPKNIREILEGACPLWPGRKVKDTHVLALIPSSVGGQPFTLERLRSLIGSPKEGHRARYRIFDGHGHEQTQAPKSHWVLMTKKVLEGTRCKAYAKQVGLIPKPYEVPTLIEAVTCILTHYVKTGERIFADNPWTCTRCIEVDRSGTWQMATGSFSPDGIDISNVTRGLNDRTRGLAAVRRL